jgi:hypothetical protein
MERPGIQFSPVGQEAIRAVIEPPALGAYAPLVMVPVRAAGPCTALIEIRTKDRGARQSTDKR